MEILQSSDAAKYALGVVGAALTAKIISKALEKEQLPLPPGPKPLPLLGNLNDLPKGDVLEGPFWAKHKELYGPISSVTVLGQTIILVHDVKIALDLMDKRSSIYSSRPVLTFGGELVKLNAVTTLLMYDEIHKVHRKTLHSYIGTRAACKVHESMEEIETRRFLWRMLVNPDEFMHNIRSLPGGIILKLSHGYSITADGHDPLVGLANVVLGTVFSEATRSGRWLVDVAPILKHVPDWMPGAGFKRTAKKWRAVVDEFYDKPYEFVRHQMGSGKAVPSFTTSLLDQGIAEQYDEDLVKGISSTLYGGGADTTVIALTTFFLAMVLYPDVFKKAQEEIDRVVGNGRLPSFADRPNLPYIDAILKESLRWEVVLQTGMPHVTTADDTYMGYRIPKGALIVPNQWFMTHNPEVYHDPSVFKPERFLGENPEMDSRIISFGFGRRICPGKELAEGTMFIAIAMTAAVFNISKAKDENGNTIEPVNEFSAGLLCHPKPFKCSITPRSENAVSLIKSVLEDHPFDPSDSEILKTL